MFSMAWVATEPALEYDSCDFCDSDDSSLPMMAPLMASSGIVAKTTSVRRQDR